MQRDSALGLWSMYVVKRIVLLQPSLPVLPCGGVGFFILNELPCFHECRIMSEKNRISPGAFSLMAALLMKGFVHLEEEAISIGGTVRDGNLAHAIRTARIKSK